MPDTDTAPAAATEQPAASPAIVEQSHEAPSERSAQWMNNLIRGDRSTEQPVSETPEDADKPDQSDKTSPTPEKIEVTADELERRVQAETDRREAKRLAAQQREERLKLRKTDAWKHAELEEQEEQQIQLLSSTTARVAIDFDQHIIEPVLGRLTDAEKAEVVKNAPTTDGIANRNGIVQGALDKIIAKARAEGAADAEKKLRRNPAFIKQTLAVVRDTDEDPDLAQGTGAVGQRVDTSDFMNSFLRVKGGRLAG